MKRILFSAIALTLALSLNAQKTTNVEGSSYDFKEIARHDAAPVLSQGYTGTCWSFSALSFFESKILNGLVSIF